MMACGAGRRWGSDGARSCCTCCLVGDPTRETSAAVLEVGAVRALLAPAFAKLVGVMIERPEHFGRGGDQAGVDLGFFVRRLFRVAPVVLEQFADDDLAAFAAFDLTPEAPPSEA